MDPLSECCGASLGDNGVCAACGLPEEFFGDPWQDDGGEE